MTKKTQEKDPGARNEKELKAFDVLKENFMSPPVLT